MLLQSFAVLSLLVLFTFTTVNSINLPVFLQKYIQNVIQSEGQLIKVVNPPISLDLVNSDQCPQPQQYLLLPIWLRDAIDTLRKHRKIAYRCPVHVDVTLTGYRCPRILMSLNSPILLVGRDYYCSSGNYYIRTTHYSISYS